MQTQLMQPGSVDVPCLERAISGGQPVERTPIQSVPFSIGRIDTADLQIDSGRVSREHAVIIKEGKSYRLRDLGSTNGTYVNGQAIDEVTLNDGDMVVIADREYVFVAAPGQQNQRMVTQVMSACSPQDDPYDRVLAVRRLQESLLHRGFRPQLLSIIDLGSSQAVGYFSESLGSAQGPQNADWLTSPLAACSPSVWQANQLHRSLAAEVFLEDKKNEVLILSVSAEEVEGNRELSSQLAQLRSLVGENNLAVSLPFGLADTDDHPLLAELRQANFLLAYAGFVGGRTHIAKLETRPPDFLLLSPTMSRDLRGARPRRQLASIPEACDEIGTRPIICGLAKREDEEACRELGFQLALGTHKQAGKASSGKVLAAAN